MVRLLSPAEKSGIQGEVAERCDNRRREVALMTLKMKRDRKLRNVGSLRKLEKVGKEILPQASHSALLCGPSDLDNSKSYICVVSDTNFVIICCSNNRN